MTVQNAIKKLSKHGKVQHNCTGQYWAWIGAYCVSFLANGEDKPDSDTTCFHTRRHNERDDLTTDYFCGTYWDNLTQAINAAIRWQEQDKRNAR